MPEGENQPTSALPAEDLNPLEAIALEVAEPRPVVWKEPPSSPLGLRFVAVLMDLLLTLLLLMGAFLFGESFDPPTDQYVGVVGALLCLWSLPALEFFLGATPGKQLMSLCVRDPYGRRARRSPLLLRLLFRNFLFVGLSLYWSLYIVSYILGVSFTPIAELLSVILIGGIIFHVLDAFAAVGLQGVTLHDRWSGTRVIETSILMLRSFNGVLPPDEVGAGFAVVETPAAENGAD